MQNTESLPPGSLQVFKSFPGQPRTPRSASLFLPLSPIPPHFAYAWFSTLLSISLSLSPPLALSLSLSLSALHTDLLSLPTSPDQWTAGKSRRARRASLHLLQLRVHACARFTVRRLPTHTALSRALSLHSASSVDHSTPLRTNRVHACARPRALKATTHISESPEVDFFSPSVFFYFFPGELRPLISTLPA